MDPGVGDDSEHELCRLTSRRFESSAIGTLCLVGRLGSRTDNGRIVVVYIRIVGPDSCRLGGRLSVAGDVSSLRPNKADEVVDGPRFFIRDLK